MSNRRQSHAHRQLQLINHVVRYRMTTAGAVAGDMALPIQSVPVAKRCLSELVKSGHLGQAPLYRKRSYCYLTSLGVDAYTKTATYQALSTDSRPAFGPLSEPAKIRAYAMLAFCCLSSELHIRLTREHFEHAMPDLYRLGMPMSYYVTNRSCHTAIGFLRVNFGGIGRWDRVVQKVRHDIESHWQHSGFRALIQDERFEVAIVTSTHAKCQRLQQSFANDHRLRPVSLRIVVISELIHLLAPPATMSTTRAQP